MAGLAHNLPATDSSFPKCGWRLLTTGSTLNQPSPTTCHIYLELRPHLHVCPSLAVATRAKQTGMRLVGALPPLLPVSCQSSAQHDANGQPAPNAKQQVPCREQQTIDVLPTTSSQHQTANYKPRRAAVLRTAAGWQTCQPAHSSPSFLSRSRQCISRSIGHHRPPV